jgi:hypothetical protein
MMNFGYNTPGLPEIFGIAMLPVVIIIVSLWDIFWKLKGMWKAAKNGSVAWFIALMIFNTVGILPILYLYVFSKNSKAKKAK